MSFGPDRTPVVYPVLGWFEVADALVAVGDGALAETIRRAMDGERICISLELTVVAHPAGAPGPARAIPGQLIEYEDDRWLLWLADAGPVRGDQAEGGREAVALLLRALSLPTAPHITTHSERANQTS